MVDPISALQKEFISLSVSMYNALGILQRDALPVPPGDRTTTGEPEVRNKLLQDIVTHSKEIDKQLQLTANMMIPEREGAQIKINSMLERLPEAIKVKEQSIGELEERIKQQETLFRQLVIEHLRQQL